jgi:hypothetical protein
VTPSRRARQCLLTLAMFGAGAIACTTSGSSATQAERPTAVPGPSPGPSATDSSKAESLVTRPTAEAIAQAARDHVPTQEEQALAVVYWGFLIRSQQQGDVDVTALPELQTAMLEVAKGYPSFFEVDGQGNTKLVVRSVTTRLDFACDNSCKPSTALLFSSASGVADAVRAVTGAPGLVSRLTGISQGVIDAVSAGKSLKSALGALDANNITGALVDLGRFLAAANVELAVSAAEAVAMAEVAAVWVAFSAGYGVGQVINLGIECAEFKSANCCGAHAKCSTVTTRTCSGTKVVSVGSVCVSGACAPAETPVEECAPGRCDKGVCTTTCGGGPDACAAADLACINDVCTRCGRPGGPACPATGCSVFPDMAVNRGGTCIAAGQFGQPCLDNGSCAPSPSAGYRVFCGASGLCEYGATMGTRCDNGVCLEGSCVGGYCVESPRTKGLEFPHNPNTEYCGRSGQPVCAGATDKGEPYPDGCSPAFGANTPAGGSCVQCGVGTTCCAGSPSCVNGTEPRSGSTGEPCHTDGTCDSPQLQCRNNLCTECALRGQPCCAVGAACLPGLTCTNDRCQL